MLPILRLAVRQTGVNKHHAARVWDALTEEARERNHMRFDARTFVMAALSLQEHFGLDYSVAAYRKARTDAANAAAAASAG